jgi:hypothetical protein
MGRYRLGDGSRWPGTPIDVEDLSRVFASLPAPVWRGRSEPFAGAGGTGTPTGQRSVGGADAIALGGARGSPRPVGLCGPDPYHAFAHIELDRVFA